MKIFWLVLSKQHSLLPRKHLQQTLSKILKNLVRFTFSWLWAKLPGVVKTTFYMSREAFWANTFFQKFAATKTGKSPEKKIYILMEWLCWRKIFRRSCRNYNILKLLLDIRLSNVKLIFFTNDQETFTFHLQVENSQSRR